MELSINGISVTVPTAVIEQLVRERLAGDRVQTFTREGLPAIGEVYHGGLYAGLTIYDDEPHALVLLQGDFKGNWKEALDWADKEDGVLPSRFDQLVLFKNLKTEFKGEWYWSSEPGASDASFAWLQGFDDGLQYDDHVYDSYRARAVRRIPLSNSIIQ